jgi:phosphatidylglycerol:prolipoprotein diacylglycerol transferase
MLVPSIINIHIDPVLVHIGPIALRWYGLMYVLGILAGMWIIRKYANERGINDDQLSTLFWPAAIAGFLGGRLYYVIQQPLDPYLQQPWRILATWEGGMAFYGAIFGVVLALLVTCWRANIPLWPVLDTAALLALPAQAIGRIGNIINGDVIGFPADLPWAMQYTHPATFAPSNTVAYHPAAVYELMGNVVLFAILWPLRHRFKTPGMVFALYLVGYSIAQIVIFNWRLNEIVVWELKQAQVTGLIVAAAGILLAIWLRQTARDKNQQAA